MTFIYLVLLQFPMCCHFLAVSCLLSPLPWAEFRTDWLHFTEETTERQLQAPQLTGTRFAGSKLVLAPRDSKHSLATK